METKLSIVVTLDHDKDYDVMESITPDLFNHADMVCMEIHDVREVPKMEVENLHTFRVTFQPPSETKPARTKIFSERFKHAIIVHNSESRFDNCRDCQEIAVVALRERGFNIVAIGEGTGCMYVMTNDFKPLK